MKAKTGKKRSSYFQDNRKFKKFKNGISKQLKPETPKHLKVESQLKANLPIQKSYLEQKPAVKTKENVTSVTAQIRQTGSEYTSKQRAADRRALFLQRKREKEEQPEPSKNEIWFEDVDPALIAASKEDQSVTPKTLVKEHAFDGLTRRIAMDCEFVGVGFGGRDNALARVSIVNQFGQVLFDSFVRPGEKVTDYRTRFSGVRVEDLMPEKARPFPAVQADVARIIEKRILIGHAIQNDLKVLLLSHPKRMIRDTSRYRPFRALTNGRTPALKELTSRLLGVKVQDGEHCSIEDARATMRLYMGVKTIWEASVRRKLKGGGNVLDKVLSVNQDGKTGETKRAKFLRNKLNKRLRQQSRKESS